MVHVFPFFTSTSSEWRYVVKAAAIKASLEPNNITEILQQNFMLPYSNKQWRLMNTTKILLQ